MIRVITGKNKLYKIKKLTAWLTLIFYLLQPAFAAAADVVADPNAAKNKQPVVDKAANGTTLVQIATPSAAGISHNLYQQFNVDPRGLILNNSRIIVQTQLGGYIAGNPNLAGGAARIILNEVNGTSPSYLRGFTEIAGNKADVIIANANGIYGDGFGFINAGRATLTTGTPVFGGSGSLEAFRVTGGQVAIEGKGLDGNGADRVDVISQAVSVNAGIWAKELNVVTGNNQVTYDDLTVQKLNNGSQEVSLDVGQLGGMYAGKIKLVGTAQGVGVNSQGTVSALGGDLVISQEGKIISAGNMSATGNVELTANDSITNQGKLGSQQNTTISTAGAIVNTGTVVAGQNMSITANGITSNGVIGSGIKTDGTIGTAGELTINASQTAALNGQNLAAGNLTVSGGNIDLSGAKTYAGGNLTVAGMSIDQSGATTAIGGNAQLTAAKGDIDHTGAVLQANGVITMNAAGAVKNDKNAGGTAGQITGGQVNITAQSISNRGGSIEQSGTNDMIITSQSVDNTSGTIITNGQLQANVGNLSNQNGIMAAQNQANITSQGTVDNTNGTLYAGSLTVAAAGDMLNSNGKIQAGNGASITAQNINNANGNIINISTTGTLSITASQNLNNQAGVIGSNGNLAITAGSVDNAGNHMAAQGDFSLQVNSDFTNQGTLEANGNLSITAPNLNNAAGGTINSNRTNLTATGNITNNGRIEGNQVNTTSQNLTNNATIIGNAVTVTASNVTNQGQNALIAATDTINFWTGNHLLNQDGANITSLGDINIAANSQQDANGLFVNRTQLITNKATIEAGGNLNLAAENVENLASGDPVVGTTTSMSTKVLTMAPHVVYYTDKYSSFSDIDGYLFKAQFGGPRQWGNHLNGYYVKLSITVPKDNVIVYDVSQKKLVFNDVANTPKMLISGPGVADYWDENQINNFFKTSITVNDNSSAMDQEICDFYSSRDGEQQGVYTPQRQDYTILPAYQGTSNRGDNVGYIAGPTWTGKEAGKTTAYCQSIAINANGDYVISFYPGYDPNTQLSPENTRTMDTYHSTHSPEETRTTNTTIQTEYIISTPAAGQIRVGRNMGLNIGSQFTNQYSQVAVGNAVIGNIGTLVNQGYRLKQTSTSTDQSYFRDWYITGGGFSGSELDSSHGTATFGPYISTTYIDGGIPATFTAKTIALTGTNVSNIEQRPGSTTGPQIGSTVTPPSTSGVVVSGGNQPTVSKNNGTVDFTIPQNGLYKTNTSPTAQYIVETDPRFASYKNFISSDYLLQRINYDPGMVQKRLGDAYYEQKLINDQITQLTGRRYLSGFDNSDDEYKALMDSGVAQAKTLNLVTGMALTADQVSNLTQDLVWMVEEEVTLPDGTKEKALVPQVYLCKANSVDLKSSGALIAADTVDFKLSGNLANSGTIAGSHITSIQATNLLNQNSGTIGGTGSTMLTATNDILNQSGTITGSQVLLTAGRDIKNETVTREVTASTNDGKNSWTASNTVVGAKAAIISQGNVTVVAGRDVSMQGASISSKGDTGISAGRDILVGTVVANNVSADKSAHQSFSYTDLQNVTSNISGNNVTLASQRDTSLSGAQINADSSLLVAVQGNLTVNAVKDIHTEERKFNIHGDRYAKNTTDEAVVGTNLQANKDITLSALNTAADKGNIKIVASSITSENGTVLVNANKAVNIEQETEKHESLTEMHSSDHGFLSSRTTDSRDYSLVNQVKGSLISGDQVKMQAGTDLTVKGSSVVGTNDVNLAAQGNVTITSAQETSAEDHYYHSTSSGLLSGGGLGFTIGSRSLKTTDMQQGVSQIGSTVGSVNGNVNINAGKDVKVTASDIMSGKDTNIIGQNVTIESANNTAQEKQTFEFKQSGLSVSIGNQTIDNINSVYQPIERSTQVADKRLKALYDYKAVETADNILRGKTPDGSKVADKDNSIKVSVSLGTSKQQSETDSSQTSAQQSTVTAGGNININATGTGAKDAEGKAIDGDLTVKGSKLDGKDITLTAAKDVNLLSTENTTDTKTTSSSSSTGVGVSMSPGHAPGFTVSASKSSDNGNGNTVTHTDTTVTAQDTLTIKSGQDTKLIGAKAKGDTVKMDVGRNLNLESQQDIDNYKETSSSAGGTLTIGAGAGITGSASKGKIDSNYQSVTEQTGIYAGKGGFDIQVGKNTDLKGAVISSDATPDKNKISTDTLTYSDIKNKADYSASSSGFGVGISKDGKITGGPTPSMPVNGSADSTTKSAISPGTITVRSGNVDISKLSRNTDQALNALGKIFDKETVKEKQELVNLFSQEANKAIGDLAESMIKNAKTDEEKAKWLEGGEYKVLLHAIVGGITSSIAGNGFASGAAGDGFSQLAQKQLTNITDKSLRLLVSAAIGAAAAKVVGGNAIAGASAAYNGMKYNYYRHRTHQPGEYLLVKSPIDGQYHWWIVGDDGYDHISDDKPPTTGMVFWFQDGDHLASNDDTMGWEYEKGDGGIIKDHEVDVKFSFNAFGKLYGWVDDHGYKQKAILEAKTQEYANGMIFSGSGYSGGSLAAGASTAVKDAATAAKAAEEAAAAAKAAEEAAAAAKAAQDAKAAEEAAAAAKAAEEAAAAAKAAQDAKAAEEAAAAAKAEQGKVGTSNINSLPENVQSAFEKYDASGWQGNVPGQTPGTKAGKNYQNSNGTLPTTDAAGNPITYREFDVNNKVPGSGRDAERFVVGSDGAVYYTDSHYGDILSPKGLPSFVKVK